MAGKMLNLRCKSKLGQSVLSSITDDMTVEEFKGILYSVTEIPSDDVKVLVGFPPQVLDLSNGNQTLAQLPLHSGETLIVERNFKCNEVATASTTKPKIQDTERLLNQAKKHTGFLMRRVVPANNSCLFTSVHFCINDGDFDTTAGLSLREGKHFFNNIHN